MRLSADAKHEIKALLQLVVVLAVFYFAIGQKTDALKGELNTAVRTQCLSGQTNAILGKYNDVVASLVQHENQAKNQDLKRGRNPEAANDAALVGRLKADEIQIVKQDCSKPFLP